MHYQHRGDINCCGRSHVRSQVPNPLGLYLTLPSQILSGKLNPKTPDMCVPQGIIAGAQLEINTDVKPYKVDPSRKTWKGLLSQAPSVPATLASSVAFAWNVLSPDT